MSRPARGTEGAFALWALGFRPFYLAASLFASLSVALWVLQFTGILRAPVLAGSIWHGHEMLFGYTLAVMAGFLFTAVRNWSGQPTPSGPLLMGYVALWIAGRVLVLTPYALAAAFVNAAFPIAVAAGIAVPLAKGGNRRNYFFVAVLAMAGLAALALHLSLLGMVQWPARASLQVGLDLALFIVAVIAGRVIPMFTNNGVPGTGATRKQWLERASLAGVLLLLAADLLALPSTVIAAIAALAAAAHASRLALWKPWRTAGAPLVWVLHMAYAWIPVHFAMRALGALGAIPDTLATHALTVGVIGGMTIGMMTRTARGHTGRELVADRFEVACYLLVGIAAILRVFGGIVVPGAQATMSALAGICWSAAFGLYAVRYWPVLTRERIDGKPG